MWLWAPYKWRDNLRRKNEAGNRTRQGGFQLLRKLSDAGRCPASRAERPGEQGSLSTGNVDRPGRKGCNTSLPTDTFPSFRATRHNAP